MLLPCSKLSNNFPSHLEWNLNSSPFLTRPVPYPPSTSRRQPLSSCLLHSSHTVCLVFPQLHRHISASGSLYVQLILAGMFFSHIFTCPFLSPLQTPLECHFLERTSRSTSSKKHSPRSLLPIAVCPFILFFFIALNTADYICWFVGLSTRMSAPCGSQLHSVLFTDCSIHSTQHVSSVWDTAGAQ